MLFCDCGFAINVMIVILLFVLKDTRVLCSLTFCVGVASNSIKPLQILNGWRGGNPTGCFGLVQHASLKTDRKRLLK